MRREAWQRGPILGVNAALQPAAHALLHAREDLDRILPQIRPNEVWAATGEAASIGWHLLHLAGSTERLLSYAREEPLSPAQWAWLELEKSPRPEMDLEELMRHVYAAFEAAAAQIAATPGDRLGDVRGIGRAQIPVTLGGILFHVGEHAVRHVGQVITTVKLLRASR